MTGLNFSNMMDSFIGDRGVSASQIEALKDRIENAHKKLMRREIPGLAFMELTSQDTAGVRNTAKWIRDNCENFLILGIGGSALGPRSILEALSPFHNLSRRPRVFIYDNVDPGTLNRILGVIDIDKTLVNVITKSGSTAETMAAFMILWDKFGEKAPERIIATTDPSEGNLRKIAEEKGMRTLSIPSGVGGRYSVLSPVGLLLAEVLGTDSEEMLAGAREIHDKCSEADIWKNPAYLFGALLYLMETENRRNINVMLPYADSLKPFSEWFCQLWAESLGKEDKGITPYPSLGTGDQHSQMQLWIEGPEDKVVIFLRVMDYKNDIKIPGIFKDIAGIGYLGGHMLSELIKAEEESTELALAKNRRPNMTISIPSIDPYHLGQLFYFFELATAFTGFLYGINPFNQPGVEESKNFTYGMLGKKGFEEKRREVKEAREKKNSYKL